MTDDIVHVSENTPIPIRGTVYGHVSITIDTPKSVLERIDRICLYMKEDEVKE